MELYLTVGLVLRIPTGLLATRLPQHQEGKASSDQTGLGDEIRSAFVDARLPRT